MAARVLTAHRRGGYRVLPRRRRRGAAFRSRFQAL